jgi:mannose-6-phosphate isomerase-like protein (cupin superfamily)
MSPRMEQAPSGLDGAASDGRRIEILGVTITYKVTSADTHGAFALIEYIAPPHFHGPALHEHARTTQMFYVLDGTLAFTLGEKTIMAARGTSILVPPRVIHTFWNPTAAPVTFLMLFSPGGLERYFEELAALVAAETGWPPADMSKVAALAAKYDVLSPDE